jgi:hypothetical protein
VTSTEQTNDFDALTTAVVPEDWSEVDKRAVDTVRVFGGGCGAEGRVTATRVRR